MTRIEQIEKLLSTWKANSKKAYLDGDLEYEKLSMDRAIALESALAILKMPSNNVNRPDACGCKIGDRVLNRPRFCQNCGGKL